MNLHFFTGAYTSFALNITSVRTSIEIGNFAFSFLISIVLLSLFTTLGDEKWIQWLGIAFAFSALESLLLWVGIITWLKSVCLPLTCLFIQASARALRQGKYSYFPWWIWLFGFIAWFCEVVPLPVTLEPWHRFPMFFFACNCLIHFGYAVYENTKNNKLAFWPNYSLGICVAYSLAFLMRAFHPILAKSQEGLPAFQPLPGNMLQLPIVTSMDNLFFAIAFMVKIGLFLAALKLLIRFMVVLPPKADLLSDVALHQTEYLDVNSKGGLLAAFGQTAGVEFASLVIRSPGQKKGLISWWGWFHTKFAQKLREEVGFKDSSLTESWPDGFKLDKHLKSPCILPFPNGTEAVTGMVFRGKEIISSHDWENDKNVKGVYRRLVPFLKSFVSAPVIYHGGVIGVLSLESERKSAFARTSIRNLQQMARFIAPTVHSRRQLQAQSEIHSRLNSLSKTGIAIPKLIEEIAKEIQDVLWPKSTCIVFRLGFQRVLIGRIAESPDQNVCMSILENGKEEMDEFHASVHHHFPNKMDFHDQDLRSEVNGAEQTVGIMVLSTFEVDQFDHPTLARDRLLRKSVASLLFNAVIEGAEVLLSTILSRIQADLSSDKISTPKAWFQALKKATKECGIIWIMARLSDTDQVAFFSDDPDDETWLDRLKAHKEGVISCISLSKPYKGANSALCLELTSAKTQLWLGIEPTDFEMELTIEHSPWRTFLERLAETASLALARIELQQSEKVTTQLEIKALPAILQSLWLHEMGNKACEMTISAGRAMELMIMGKIEKASSKAGELVKIANDFSRVAAVINKPIKVEDRTKAYPIHEVITLVHEHYKLLLEEKKIQLTVEIEEDICTNISFPAVFLGVSNLVGNAVKAIGSKGWIRVEAQCKAEQRVYLHVTDSGPGVSKENRNKIFRAGFSTSKSHAGAGLPGSRKVLSKCDSKLYLDDHYQDGTRFTIELPFARKPKSEEV